MEIWSYPKVYNLGHKAVGGIFKDPVHIQEKVDGSQLSWMWTSDGLYIRSKKKLQYTPKEDVHDSMFDEAVEYLSNLSVPDSLRNIVFRGEYLKTRKHNVLEYSRLPRNHLILFDAEVGEQGYVDRNQLIEFANLLDIEIIPEYANVTVSSPDDLMGFLNKESFLGGPKIEGIVIKNHNRFGKDGKALMAKFVSKKFKEKHKVAWSKEDPIQSILKALNTEARWRKAIQHLAESGELEFSPRDIGKLMKEIKRDVLEEEQEWIKDMLFKAYKREIERGLGKGFPEWYKEVFLLEKQFS